ncbi:hypothetical protein L7F22_056138 [Adiantum nelumboides]|nr:hypothetical protein [Adiantum nelumboides]
MRRHSGFVTLSWIVLVLLLLFFHIQACDDDKEYASTLFAGKFSYTRTASMESFNKGPVLLSSPSGNFFLSMLSCKLAIAHNDTTSSHVLVWSSIFPHCKMGNQYTLSFLKSGNFAVRVAQNRSNTVADPVIWATSTEGRSVTTMKLKDDGNLVLYNIANDPIWQSFAHPSSTLLSSQVLEQGRALSLSEDLYKYSLMIEPHRAVFYLIDIITQDRKPYWELLPNSSINTTIAFAALDAEGHLQLYDSASNPLVVYQSGLNRDSHVKFRGEHQRATTFASNLWRAEVTSTVIGRGGSIVKYGGNLEVYHWCIREGAWTLHSRAIKNRCQFPKACPNYQVCKGAGGKCLQMNGVPINIGKAGLDGNCEKTNFVAVKNMTYFAVEMGGESNETSLAECKATCMDTCSCVAFVYRQDSVNSCYPIYSHQPLSFLAMPNSLSSVYLRIPPTSSSRILLAGYLPLLFLLLCSSFLLSSSGKWGDRR